MTRNEYRAPNPKDMTTFPYIHVQRDTTSGFGTAVDIFTGAADTTKESTLVVDTGGTLTSWYRHRGENNPHTIETDWSDPIQFGDYWARQQIKADIPDTDITNGLWDGWRDQTFFDMQGLGLGRPAPTQDFTPASPTDYNVGLRADIRRVTRVEIWRVGPSEYWTDIRAWDQRGPSDRNVRIRSPKVGYSYKIYGVGELRDLNDLDDELWNVLYWGMRWRYLLFRQLDRTNMRPFMSRTRQTDTTTQMELQRLADAAKLQFDQRVQALLFNEGVPDGGGGQ